MPASYQCDNCGYKSVTAGKNVGSIIKCPSCRDDVLVLNPNKLPPPVIQETEQKTLTPGGHEGNAMPEPVTSGKAERKLSSPERKEDVLILDKNNIPPVEKASGIQEKSTDPLPSEGLKSSRFDADKFLKIVFFALIGCIPVIIFVIFLAKSHMGSKGAVAVDREIKSISKVAEKAPTAKPLLVVEETKPDVEQAPSLPAPLKDGNAGKPKNNDASKVKMDSRPDRVISQKLSVESTHGKIQLNAETLEKERFWLKEYNNASWIISNSFYAKTLNPVNSFSKPINTNGKFIIVDCKVTNAGNTALKLLSFCDPKIIDQKNREYRPLSGMMTLGVVPDDKNTTPLTISAGITKELRFIYEVPPEPMWFVFRPAGKMDLIDLDIK